MKKMIAIFTSIFLAISLSAQIPEITWQRCLGTSENDNSYCILKTDNGYLLGIGIEANGLGITNYHGESDAWVINIDTLGNIIWEKCFGGSESDGVIEIVKSVNSNEFYCFGYTESSDGDITCDTNYGSTDFWVVKIDIEGNMLWDRCYGSIFTDSPRDVIATPDGGLLFMGRISAGGGDVQIFYGAYDIWFCKIDSLGNIEWEKTIGNEGIDNAINLKLTSDSTFAFIGNFYETGGMVECQCDTLDYVKDVWLVEIDLDGNISRQVCFGGSHYDLGYDFEKLDNGYVLLASTQSDDGDVSGLHGSAGNPQYDDIWALKIDNNGELLWQRCLGGYSSETPNYIGQTEDGGFMVIGFTFSHNGDVSGNHSMPGGNNADIWAVKLSPEGAIEWEHCYGGWGNERFWGWHNIVGNGSHGYVVLGESDLTSNDVQCSINSGYWDDVWLFEIKDCSQYPVGNVQAITGPDTVCTVYDSTNLYTIAPVTGTWYYEWQLIPQEAGTLNGNALQATVNWATGWEGTAAITARAMNDCDTSQWSQPRYTEVFTCLGIEELNAGKVKLRVYPNPAKGFAIFELPTSANKHAVISTRGVGKGAGRRNPLATMTPTGKPQETSNARNSQEMSHSSAQGQVQRFDMTGGDDLAVVVIVNVYGQQVASLLLKAEKTVWDTRQTKSGICFYRMEIDGKVLSGKIVVQK